MNINRNLFFSSISILIVTVVSFFTYFYNRDSYNKFIWDEHYHVASAQKYINHVHFMEPHPPFGKMIIAWGEQLLKYNKKNDQLINKMKSEGQDLPEDFSFSGYRFFPMLLAWLLAPLLFLIVKNLTKSNIIALGFSLFYALDNAMLVHFRTAMLDATLLFFMTLNFYLFLLIRKRILNSKDATFLSILFGISFALTMTTKVTGLINIIFPIWLLYLAFVNFANKAKILKLLFAMIIPFFITYFAVWEYHFAHGTKVISSLDAKGYFIKNDDKLKEILDNKQGANPLNYFTMLKYNAFQFVKQYEKGVPHLNLCNEAENGSPFFMWPIGARAIQYVQHTKNNITKYLYLQVNPIVWLVGLIGIIVGLSVFVVSLFCDVPIIKDEDKDKDKNKDKDIFYILILSYLGYMAAIGLIDRVMYLYHYFPALIFSLLIAAMLFKNTDKLFNFNISKMFKVFFIAFLSILSIIAFYIYTPLTYFKPIPQDYIKKLSLNSMWDLKCPNCERTNHFAKPIEKKGSNRTFETNLALGDVDSFYVQQDWGEPQIGQSVIKKEVLVNDKKYNYIFGLHANSKIKYRLKGRFNTFSSFVGLPDYLINDDGQGSIIFKVIGDGKVLWQSSKMQAGKRAEMAHVNVKGINILELVMDGTGDAIDYDHGVWLEPRLN
ncbi:MAG: phospholipid carrier-dependent glycosyltransferase [Bdellovibrionota bacterium]